VYRVVYLQLEINCVVDKLELVTTENQVFCSLKHSVMSSPYIIIVIEFVYSLRVPSI